VQDQYYSFYPLHLLLHGNAIVTKYRGGKKLNVKYLRAPVTNSEVHNEMNSGNACFYSVLNCSHPFTVLNNKQDSGYHVFVPGRCPF